MAQRYAAAGSQDGPAMDFHTCTTLSEDCKKIDEEWHDAEASVSPRLLDHVLGLRRSGSSQ